MITSGATSALAKDILSLQPIYVPAAITVTAMQIRTTVAGSASSVARLGIYSTTAAFGAGALVLDAGTVALDGGTGIKTKAGLSQVLTSGWYFLALLHDSATTPTLVDYRHHPIAGTLWRGHETGNPLLLDLSAAQAYGSLPDPTPTPTLNFSTGYGIRSTITLRWT